MARKEVAVLVAAEMQAESDTRERFAEIIMKAAPKIQGFGGQYSLVVYSIDNIEFIKESFGQEDASRVLGEINGIVRRRIREIDALINWDCTDFIILAQGADAASARALAERIRKEVEAHSFEPIIKVNLSFCVASFRPEGGFSAPLSNGGNLNRAFA
ncbi:MAG: diguanylate cyclase [Deltaproteobacteria bacterium]|nr:diguanylate cyclase [Deltaproteobacteria bacterium]